MSKGVETRKHLWEKQSSLAEAGSLCSFHSFIPLTNIYGAQILVQALCSALGT